MASKEGAVSHEAINIGHQHHHPPSLASKPLKDTTNQTDSAPSGYYFNAAQKGKLILPTALWILLIIAGVTFLSLLVSLNKTIDTLDTLVELEQEKAAHHERMEHLHHDKRRQQNKEEQPEDHDHTSQQPHHHHHQQEQPERLSLFGTSDNSDEERWLDSFVPIKTSWLALPSWTSLEPIRNEPNAADNRGPVSPDRIVDEFMRRTMDAANMQGGADSMPEISGSFIISTSSSPDNDEAQQQKPTEHMGSILQRMLPMFLQGSDQSAQTRPSLVDMLGGSESAKGSQQDDILPAISGPLISANIDNLNVNLNLPKDSAEREKDNGPSSSGISLLFANTDKSKPRDETPHSMVVIRARDDTPRRMVIIKASSPYELPVGSPISSPVGDFHETSPSTADKLSSKPALDKAIEDAKWDMLAKDLADTLVDKWILEEQQQQKQPQQEQKTLDQSEQLLPQSSLFPPIFPEAFGEKKELANEQKTTAKDEISDRKETASPDITTGEPSLGDIIGTMFAMPQFGGDQQQRATSESSNAESSSLSSPPSSPVATRIILTSTTPLAEMISEDEAPANIPMIDLAKFVKTTAPVESEPKQNADTAASGADSLASSITAKPIESSSTETAITAIKSSDEPGTSIAITTSTTPASAADATSTSTTTPATTSGIDNGNSSGKSRKSFFDTANELLERNMNHFRRLF